jgi:hypothetical protein
MPGGFATMAGDRLYCINRHVRYQESTDVASQNRSEVRSMAIEVWCACGKRFRAKDEYAGLRGMCPACKRIFEIPVPGESARVQHASPATIPAPSQRVESVAPPEAHASELGGSMAAPVLGSESRRPCWRDPIPVIGAPILAPILIGFAIYLYREYSVKRFLFEIDKAKKTADALASSEKSRRAALDRYDETLAKIEQRSANHPMLKKYAVAIKQARDKLYPLVKDEIVEEERAQEGQKVKPKIQLLGEANMIKVVKV